jgi:thiol-disulfide isomerase/thioredoxin
MALFERVHLPSFAGATEWLNSEPLGPAELEGHVVLVNFWTLTCINWLRQEPYVRAWSQAYRDDGLIVIGVHTPEFSFEHDVELVRQATKERAIDYPVAVDNDYEVWRRSPIITGRPCTSPTGTASSATATLAKDATRNRSASSSTCWASSARSSPSKDSASRRHPIGTTCLRPRPISGLRAAISCRHPTAPDPRITARTCRPSAWP